MRYLDDCAEEPQLDLSPHQLVTRPSKIPGGGHACLACTQHPIHETNLTDPEVPGNGTFSWWEMPVPEEAAELWKTLTRNIPRLEQAPSLAGQLLELNPPSVCDAQKDGNIEKVQRKQV